MVRVSEVADNVFQIHPELNFMFSLSYLVTGDESVLIDPGSTTQADIVLRAIEEELKFDLDSIAYIIPTHLHIDHGGGAGHIARKLPQAKIAVYERHAKHLINTTKLVDAYKQTFGENFAHKFGPVLAVPENQILKVADSDIIDLGDRKLRVIYARGHANHHFCLLDNKSGGLFCGDTAGMYFPDVDGVVIICPDGFDLDRQLETIEHLRSLAPRLLFYAHEGTGNRPDELMQRAAQELNDCGDVILKALKAGENSNQVEQRLNAYFAYNVSTDINYEKMFLDLTVAGYRRYFEKTGKLAKERQN